MPECRWAVPADHPAFAGHFPGRPILPGVVILDQVVHGAAQVLGCPPAGCRISTAKFLRPVAPGETLDFAFDAASETGLRFRVYVAGNIVANGNIEWPD
ncbi:MAG: hypothetical protein WBP72_00045 [Rhodocyclaceae bacterium]